MNKNKKNFRFLKPLSLAFMSCLFATTISSCSQSEYKYSSIDGKTTYMSLGSGETSEKYKVTNEQIYNEIKWSASSIISEKINRTIIQEEYELVENLIVGKSDENKIDLSKYDYNDIIREQAINELQKYMICDIYGIDSYSNYTGLNNPYTKKTYEYTFIQNLWSEHRISINQEELNQLLERKSCDPSNPDDMYDEDYEKGIYAFDYNKLNEAQKSILELYYENIAQKIYAVKVLKTEIDEYNDDIEDDEERYYSNSEYISYWKENYKYDNSVNAIVIRFINEDECNAVLKTFGLKTYRSQLYYIPQNEMSDTEYSEYYDEYDFTAPNTTNKPIPLKSEKSLAFAIYLEMYNYIYTYRNKLITNIENDNITTNMRNVTQKYYEDYKTSDVLDNMYKPYEYVEHLEKNNPELYEQIHWTKEELDKINSSLGTYIYDTLEEAGSIGDITELNDCYSYQGQSYGDYYYMAFKINFANDENDSNKEISKTLYYTDKQEDEIVRVDENNKVFRYVGNEKVYYDDSEIKDSYFSDLVVYDYEKDKDGNITETLNVAETNKVRTAYYKLLEKITDGLKEETLTSSYISNCVTNAAENVKVRVYDEEIEIAYLSSNDDYKKNRKSGADDLVCTIEYEDEDMEREASASIYMVDVWNELEPYNGITNAVSLLSKEIVKESNAYQKVINDKEKLDLYYQSVNNLLSNFAADNLSSSGYSASLGKHNFLMLYFHTNDIEDIIYDYYCVNEASTSLINNYSSIDLAKFLQTYANNYYDKYFSVSAVNLLVYVDMDEDGEPDRTETGLSYVDSNFDWNDEVPTEAGTTYAELAQELINKIIKLCDYSTDSNADTIENIITEYNSASRFTNGHDTDGTDEDYDPTQPESTWAKYRRAGLFIKSEEISCDNTTDYATCNDVLKLALYKAYCNEFFFEGKEGVMPNEYMLRSYYEGDNNGLYSSFGYNLPILTSATTKESAYFGPVDYEKDTEYDSTKDWKDTIYNNLVYLYNEEAFKIENIYSLVEDGILTDKISINQVLAFMLEYAAEGSISTLPTDLTTALTTYLQPAFERYTSDETQFEVLLCYMANFLNEKVENGYDFVKFGTSSLDIKMSSSEDLNKLLDYNHVSADDFAISDAVYDSNSKLTFFGNEENVELYYELLSQYTGWWDDLSENIAKFIKEDK